MAGRFLGTDEDQYVAEIMNHWFEKHRPLYGPPLRTLFKKAPLPRSYMVIDLETTGFGPKDDYIVEVGWAIVVDCQLVNSDSLLLDWSQYPAADLGYIRYRLEQLQRTMAGGGRAWHITYEQLVREGVNPLEALQVLLQLLEKELMRTDGMVVGHSIAFDKRMLDAHTQDYFGKTAPWELQTQCDTGTIEKAAQSRLTPWEGETKAEWEKRMVGHKTAVKWGLDTHCNEKYKLAERYGLDISLAHSARFDCLLTHYLLETFRELSQL